MKNQLLKQQIGLLDWRRMEQKQILEKPVEVKPTQVYIESAGHV
jgi:hypothetical protein